MPHCMETRISKAFFRESSVEGKSLFCYSLPRKQQPHVFLSVALTEYTDEYIAGK